MFINQVANQYIKMAGNSGSCCLRAYENPLVFLDKAGYEKKRVSEGGSLRGEVDQPQQWKHGDGMVMVW